MEEYGNTASEDRWSSPKLDYLMPTRKERSVAEFHNQDQGSGQGGSLVTISGDKLKIMIDGVLNDHEWKSTYLEEIEAGGSAVENPWWCSLNEAMEAA